LGLIPDHDIFNMEKDDRLVSCNCFVGYDVLSSLDLPKGGPGRPDPNRPAMTIEKNLNWNQMSRHHSVPLMNLTVREGQFN